MGIPEAIISVARATEALFTFLSTPEGQNVVKDFRANNAKFEQDIQRIGNWFETTFKIQQKIG